MTHQRLGWLVPLAGLLLTGCASVAANSTPAAATVNGHDISMRSYNTEVMFMRRQQVQDSGQVDVCSLRNMAALCTQLKKAALNTLIGEEIGREYAAAHHITVSNTEFNTQWALVVRTRFHSNIPAMKATAKASGITVADLKAMVRQDLLQQKVLYDVTKNMQVVGPAVDVSRAVVTSQSQLRSVQSQLRRGVPFSTIVTKLHAVPNTPCAQPGVCGNLGWLPVSLLSSDEAAVKTAAPGTVVGPFVTQSGISLIQVVGHNPHYLPTAAQELAMRQQMYSNWLTKQVAHAKITRHVAV